MSWWCRTRPLRNKCIRHHSTTACGLSCPLDGLSSCCLVQSVCCQGKRLARQERLNLPRHSFCSHDQLEINRMNVAARCRLSPVADKTCNGRLCEVEIVRYAHEVGAEDQRRLRAFLKKKAITKNQSLDAPQAEVRGSNPTWRTTPLGQAFLGRLWSKKCFEGACPSKPFSALASAKGEGEGGQAPARQAAVGGWRFSGCQFSMAVPFESRPTWCWRSDAAHFTLI